MKVLRVTSTNQNKDYFNLTKSILEEVVEAVDLRYYVEDSTFSEGLSAKTNSMTSYTVRFCKQPPLSFVGLAFSSAGIHLSGANDNELYMIFKEVIESKGLVMVESDYTPTNK